MSKIKSTLRDLRQFCRTNGYFFAAYGTDFPAGTDWHLQDMNAERDEDTFPDDMVIDCDVLGSAVSYAETKSEDGVFVFRLHNNYNLPQVIPCF